MSQVLYYKITNYILVYLCNHMALKQFVNLEILSEKMLHVNFSLKNRPQRIILEESRQLRNQNSSSFSSRKSLKIVTRLILDYEIIDIDILTQTHIFLAETVFFEMMHIFNIVGHEKGYTLGENTSKISDRAVSCIKFSWT